MEAPKPRQRSPEDRAVQKANGAHRKGGERNHAQSQAEGEEKRFQRVAESLGARREKTIRPARKATSSVRIVMISASMPEA